MIDSKTASKQNTRVRERGDGEWKRQEVTEYERDIETDRWERERERERERENDRKGGDAKKQTWEEWQRIHNISQHLF